MKSKILVLGMLACFLVISCSKNENKDSASSSDMVSTAKIDNVSDDVSQIVELNSDATPSGRLNGTTESFLSNCATITTTQSGNTWTRTIDFGSTNCTLNNGNIVRGQIILTFTNDFAASTRTINYAFVNFYHNDRHVEGNRSVVRTILPSGHPQATIDMNLTVTTPSGDVYTRVGTRVREFTVGYGDSDLTNNVYSVTGHWSTTVPNGNIHTTTITSALLIKCNCFQLVAGEHHVEIVSGVLSITRNSNSAVIDYGTGGCDNQATISINGGQPTIFFLSN